MFMIILNIVHRGAFKGGNLLRGEKLGGLYYMTYKRRIPSLTQTINYNKNMNY